MKKTNSLKRDLGGLQRLNKSVVVYNFHSLTNKNRFFLFLNNTTQSSKTTLVNRSHTVESLSELFFASNWLERECSELSGINFSGKKDLRNLMLQYGDTSKPFLKRVPTIGFEEFIYDVMDDTVKKQHINSSFKSKDNYVFI